LYSDYRQQLWTKNERHLFSEICESRFAQIRDQLSNSIARYIEVFGRDHVHIVDYHGSRSSGDITNAMLSAASLPVFDEEISDPHPGEGIGQQEVYLRQLWAMLEEHAQSQNNCTLAWPANPTSMMVDMPEIIFNASLVPTKCFDVDSIKNMALSADQDYRKTFSDIMLFGREDLVRDSILGFPQICEVDSQAIKGSAAWQDQFNRQLSALPTGACLPGLTPPAWHPHAFAEWEEVN